MIPLATIVTLHWLHGRLGKNTLAYTCTCSWDRVRLAGLEFVYRIHVLLASPGEKLGWKLVDFDWIGFLKEIK
jgi:hypothetical protein